MSYPSLKACRTKSSLKGTGSMKLVIAAKKTDSQSSLIDQILIEANSNLNDIIDLGGETWDCKETSVSADAVTDLQEKLSNQIGDHPVEFAFVPDANRKKKLLISDMDSTIIGQECIDELADFAGKKDEVSEITERAMRGELDFDGALKTRVEMLKGLSTSVLEDCFNARISLNEGARTVVKTMEANGARCVLVSGGFTFFTSRVQELAGFHHNRANTLIIENEEMTGEVGLPILGREAKLVALNEEAEIAGATAADALAMGDGANDLAMIEAAGMGLAYCAKPVVSAQADVSIKGSSLIPALFFQGYSEAEFVTD